jgi:hypothetical protein
VVIAVAGETEDLGLNTALVSGYKRYSNISRSDFDCIRIAADDSVSGLPDFSKHNIPKRGKIYQITTKLPNGYKIYQMAAIYSK